MAFNRISCGIDFREDGVVPITVELNAVVQDMRTRPAGGFS
ncbi:hypothetical protein [Streptomyces sp. ISL-11]|nr:hypothetical protein [Streptomyces sp. ISL-11]